LIFKNPTNLCDGRDIEATLPFWAYFLEAHQGGRLFESARARHFQQL
jgi:hypothetical protein